MNYRSQDSRTHGKCNTCGELKEWNCFTTDKSRSNGYGKRCKTCEKERNKKFRDANRERVMIREAELREINREKSRAYKKAWKAANKDKFKRWNEMAKAKPLYRIKAQCRKVIQEAFHRRLLVKSKKFNTIVGMSVEQLVAYLISDYEKRTGTKPDLSIKGAYHVDHIIPLRLAKTEDEVIKLNHYSNLQLLTAQENLTKSGKFIGPLPK